MKKIFSILVLILVSIILQGSVGDPLDPSSNAVDHAARGMWYARWKNYYAAIQEYRIAIALNPESSASASFYNNLGLVYFEIGQQNWAQQCFEYAIKLNSNCINYYENLIESYYKEGTLSQKEKILTNKLKKSFDDSSLWLMLGLIQEKSKKFSKAIESFNNYLLLEPKIFIASAVKNKVGILVEKNKEKELLRL